MSPAVRYLLQLVLLGVLVWAMAPGAAERSRAAGDAQAVVTAMAGPIDRCHELLGGEVPCDAGTLPQGPPAVGPGRLVVDLQDGSTAADLAAISTDIGAELRWVHPLAEDEALAVADVADLGAALAALAGDTRVEVAEPELLMQLTDVAGQDGWSLPGRLAGWPDDPLYTRQWNLRAMNADAGWWGTEQGAGVIVAVIDTGVAKVEDLAGTTVLPGASFVPGTRDATDDNGHGTHVAGTIAQTTNNGLGVAGVAPRASILPVKVLAATGGGTSEQVAAGIDWAVDNGAQVINLSLGGSAYSAVVHNAARKARAAGVLVVAAAGNDGRLGPSYPGALSEVIGVSAVGPDGELAPYSNWGLGVDIAAPGGDKRKADGGIVQDTIDPSGHAYRELQGTSMATPHVSGALAALLSLGFVSADEAEALLLSGADGVAWNPRFGYGHLDMAGSLALLGGGPDRAPRFFLGALAAWMAAAMGTRAVGFRLLAALVGGVTAGGVMGAGVLPGMLGAMLSRGVLSWPALWLSPGWAQVPIWLSALLPISVAFVLGPTRAGRPLAMGLAAGVGAHLAWGMAAGAFAPWWMPSTFTAWWLGANVLLCALVVLTLAGVERLEGRKGG